MISHLEVDHESTDVHACVCVKCMSVCVRVCVCMCVCVCVYVVEYHEVSDARAVLEIALCTGGRVVLLGESCSEKNSF